MHAIAEKNLFDHLEVGLSEMKNIILIDQYWAVKLVLLSADVGIGNL